MYKEDVELTILMLEEVEGRKDLPVVGHEGLPYQGCRHDQLLQDFQDRADHPHIPGVEGACGQCQGRLHSGHC